MALHHLDRGAAHAASGSDAGGGRPRPHVAVFAYGAIDDDRSEALDRARSIAAWFPQTAPVICQLAGLSADLVEQVRRSYGGGEFQEATGAAKLLPDDFVRKVALAGDRTDARPDRDGARRRRRLGPRLPPRGEPDGHCTGLRGVLAGCDRRLIRAPSPMPPEISRVMV